MKILFIGAYEYLYLIKEKGNSHMYDLWMYLINNTTSFSLWTLNNFNFTDILNFSPDIIWIFDCMTVSDSFIPLLEVCKLLKKPIVFLGDDLFYIEQIKKCKNFIFIDAIVFLIKMEKLEKQYITEFPKKIIKHFSNPFINVEKFHSHDENNKIYDITIYGSTDEFQKVDNFPLNIVHKEYLDEWKKRNNINKLPNELNFYEFRKRIKNLLIKTNKYKLNIIEPSTKGCWDCPIRGEKLSIEINKAYLSLATRTCIDKCMQKYIEIAASDTIILGNIPTDFKNLLNGNIVEINDDMSDEKILNIVDSVLQNKQLLEKNAKIFGKKIRNTYGSNTDTLLIDFLKISNEIISEYKMKYNI